MNNPTRYNINNHLVVNDQGNFVTWEEYTKVKERLDVLEEMIPRNAQLGEKFYRLSDVLMVAQQLVNEKIADKKKNSTSEDK